MNGYTTLVRRLLVVGLLHACKILDRLPRLYRWDGKWHAALRGGCWGCDLGLADLSLRLDDRWQTGVWS